VKINTMRGKLTYGSVQLRTAENVPK